MFLKCAVLIRDRRHPAVCSGPERLLAGRHLVLIQPEEKMPVCLALQPQKQEHSVGKSPCMQICVWLAFYPLSLWSALGVLSIETTACN